MASNRFFAYDPYYYYTAADPYYYTAADPYYYQRQPAPAGRATAKPPAAARPAPPRARWEEEEDTATSFWIPVHGPDSDPEPEPKPAARAMMSLEEAVVRMQAAARGFQARRSVRAVREVQREAERVGASVLEALAADPRARAAVAEQLMRLLLRLDAVRGAREYRRSVTRRVLALQDAVDALETVLAPAPVGEEAEAETDAPDAAADVEMPEEKAVAPERGSEMEEIVKTVVHMPAQMEEANEAVAAAGEEEEEEAVPVTVPGDANVDLDEQEEDSDADGEGEWEMVTDENEEAPPVAATSDDDDQEPPRKETAACPSLETTRTASAGADGGGVDASKLMEMVAALCEENAQQRAVIGALADRVDALERTVRRMEDAERAAAGGGPRS